MGKELTPWRVKYIVSRGIFSGLGVRVLVG